MKLCVDIGNSRIKLALVQGILVDQSTPNSTMALADRESSWSKLDAWLNDFALAHNSISCSIASVHNSSCREFVQRMQERDDIATTRVLSWEDFPMKVAVDHPEGVGVDRLAAALAARDLNDKGRAAIVVDLGTAITIDLVSTEGAFEGGAILPGIELAAKALQTSTDALPRVDVSHGTGPIVMPGKSTEAAIAAGLHWGTIGSIREIVRQLGEGQDPEPAVFVTGGASPSLAPELEPSVRHEEHLVLRGVALAAEGSSDDFTAILSSKSPSGLMKQPEDGTTRVAVLTPASRGAVATLAVCGPQAVQLTDQLFRSAVGNPLSKRFSNRICFGRWNDTEIGEEVVVCGRNDQLVEIHCHGGRTAPARILADLLEVGCVEASPNEFARADTDAIAHAAAEALADARTERTAAILLDQLDGVLQRELEACMALLGADETDEVRKRLRILADRGGLGIHLTQPWRVVIAGAPNVGKSSLLNALVGYDRSIVLNSPGTTRDVVATSTVIDGWPVLLSDTAGIRATSDNIEATGVTLAEDQLANADLVVLMFDRSQPWSDSNQELADSWPQALIIHNKADLPAETDDGRPPGLTVSATHQTGLSLLQEQISNHLVPDPPASGLAVPFTDEQIQRLRSAESAIGREDNQAATAEIRELLS